MLQLPPVRRDSKPPQSMPCSRAGTTVPGLRGGFGVLDGAGQSHRSRTGLLACKVHPHMRHKNFCGARAHVSIHAAGGQISGHHWVELFLEGRITKEMRLLQNFHCTASPCHMNGAEWVKHFISRLLYISHGQWVLRNFTLHDQTRGYLRLQD